MIKRQKQHHYYGSHLPIIICPALWAVKGYYKNTTIGNTVINKETQKKREKRMLKNMKLKKKL